MAQPKLGSGKRFDNLATALASKGAHDPKALAAFIGRKKLGKKKFQGLAAKGAKGAKGKGDSENEATPDSEKGGM